ncbi:sigma-E factor negative regulatory protein [Massilia soli]|uniref:Sigma-E factor negative regulatory protein n=1 Tax=Massilia soli TaxID=2792854 RepID=A0ABS7SPJ5_9BURK|nr:sigma-E factor negative regulatory protein [Massilia soli]MBZ2208102.1 sigma-E factor negative regulatory protein [Massilia soli]
MDTHKKIREHISALSDGELPSADLELAFAALQSIDGQHAWNTYFRIGDELRAQASPSLSDGFAERLAERLAAEPAHPRRAAANAATAAAPARGADGAPAEPPAKPAIINAS